MVYGAYGAYGSFIFLSLLIALVNYSCEETLFVRTYGDCRKPCRIRFEFVAAHVEQKGDALFAVRLCTALN